MDSNRSFKTNDSVFKAVLENGTASILPTRNKFLLTDGMRIIQKAIPGDQPDTQKGIYSIQMPQAVILDSTLLAGLPATTGHLTSIIRSMSDHPLVMTNYWRSDTIRYGAAYSYTGCKPISAPISTSTVIQPSISSCFAGDD